MKIFKFSEQAIVAIAMAYQKALLEQQDLGEILAGLEFGDSPDGINCMNPPTLDMAVVQELLGDEVIEEE